jgi:pimeloyl-ACP methyl ester carboxylesterase
MPAAERATAVLIPGLARDAELLAPQAQALRATGHGVHDSLVHFNAFTLPAMAERLRADTPELVALRRQACTLFAAGRMDEVLRANVAFAFHPNSARDPGLVVRYLAMVRRAGAEALIRQNEAVMARPDLRAQLPSVACPVLVMVGEADQLTPPEHAREIAAAVPDARHEVLPGAGHMLSWEQPGRVNALLSGWLGSV